MRNFLKIKIKQKIFENLNYSYKKANFGLNKFVKC